MILHIDKVVDDFEMKEFQYMWWYERNGCNEGFGYSRTEKQALKDASMYYNLNHKWED